MTCCPVKIKTAVRVTQVIHIREWVSELGNIMSWTGFFLHLDSVNNAEGDTIAPTQQSQCRISAEQTPQSEEFGLNQWYGLKA